jgi:hypothetical protein
MKGLDSLVLSTDYLCGHVKEMNIRDLLQRTFEGVTLSNF